MLLFHMMGFSMLPSAMNRPFSYPEDYISDPDSNLILVTRLLHLIWTVTSPNFVSRVEVRAGKVDLEHAEDKRGAVPAEPVHHVACAAQEEVPGEEAQEDARPAQVLPHNAERHHAEGARHEVRVHLFNIMIKDRC